MNLLFDSLEIKGFRAFKDLRIEKLGRVNLIVGQNNVGKTCLLEALQLYANRGHPDFLWQLLEAHNQNTQIVPSLAESNGRGKLSVLKKLFYDWPDLTKPIDPIEIGPLNEPQARMRLSLAWDAFEEEGKKPLGVPSPNGHNKIDPALPHFAIQIGENPTITYPLEGSLSAAPREPESESITCLLTEGSNGLNESQINALWNHIPSPDLHQEVVQALNIIAPGVENIDFVDDPKQDRFPVLIVPDMEEPLPIRALGTGVQHLLAIMVSLVNAKDGLLLIDEIENGLYYRSQTDLWKLIFKLAHQLNIQVFATAHSGDCVLSFQQALTSITKVESPTWLWDSSVPEGCLANVGKGPQEGMIIRLDVKKDDICPTLYYEWMLINPNTWDIEVR